MEAITVNRYIEVICPVCKARRVIQVPKSIVDQTSRLTTISVPQHRVCKHHFQLFIDKNFSIRGYQKVDYQLNSEETKKDSKFKPTYKDHYVNSLELYQSNESGKNSSKEIKRQPDNENRINNFEENFNKKHKMTLQEIYEEFWEFIDDNNEIFQRFIEDDKERRTILKLKDFPSQTENSSVKTIPKN